MKITFDADGQIIEVPYNLELLERCNETMNKFLKAEWFPIGRNARRTDVLIEFANHYFPTKFDWKNSNPMLAAFFFQRVRDQLIGSINNWEESIRSTAESTTLTGESPTNPLK